VNPIPDGSADECDQLQSIRRLTGTRIVLKRELPINQKGFAGCQYFAHQIPVAIKTKRHVLRRHIQQFQGAAIVRGRADLEDFTVAVSGSVDVSIRSAKNSRLQQEILVLQGERLQLQDLVAVE
jgi:hypothetical protein